MCLQGADIAKALKIFCDSLKWPQDVTSDYDAKDKGDWGISWFEVPTSFYLSTGWRCPIRTGGTGAKTTYLEYDNPNALLLPDAKRAVSLQISVRMCYHSGVRFAAELFYLNSMQQKETLDYVWSYYQRLNGSLALNESTIISEEPGDFHRFRSCIEDCTLEMALESEFHEASSCTSKWWRIVTASFLVVSNYLHLYSPVPAT
jgi:hypothetical protein